MTALAFAASLLAFALFGLADHDQGARWLRRRLPEAMRRNVRAGAWAALALGFVAAVAARGWAFGPVLWFGLVMLAAGAVFLFLNLAGPRTGRR